MTKKEIDYIEATFSHDDPGFCKRVYTAITHYKDGSVSEKPYLLCTIDDDCLEHREFYTCTPDWEEPECPVRADIEIRVMESAS